MAKIPINDDEQIRRNAATRDPMPDEVAEPMNDEPAAAGTAVDDNARLKQERDDLYERLALATADFKNAQRRLQQDKEQAVAFANSSLITSLLPVIDNFERALAVDEQATDVPALRRGMQIVHDQWLKVLEAHDVLLIVPKAGDVFDPHRHHALVQHDRPDLPAKSVAQLLQTGYEMRGRVLRPAGVAVSKTGES